MNLRDEEDGSEKWRMQQIKVSLISMMLMMMMMITMMARTTIQMKRMRRRKQRMRRRGKRRWRTYSKKSLQENNYCEISEM